MSRESGREWNEVVAEIIEEDHDLLDALCDKFRRMDEMDTDEFVPLGGGRPLLDMADTGDVDDDFERAVTDARESLDRSTDRHDRRREELQRDVATLRERLGNDISTETIVNAVRETRQEK